MRLAAGDSALNLAGVANDDVESNAGMCRVEVRQASRQPVARDGMACGDQDGPGRESGGRERYRVSSAAMAAEAADWVIPSAVAARVTCPRSATATKIRNWSRVIAPIIDFTHGFDKK
jgi:hypothetical protein